MVCIFFTPFFTAVYIVELLVLRTIYVLNKKIRQCLDLKSKVISKQERVIMTGAQFLGKSFWEQPRLFFFFYISDPFKLTVGILQNISISVEIRLMSGNTTSSVHLKSHNFRVWLKQLSPAWGWEEDEEELFPFSFLIFFFFASTSFLSSPLGNKSLSHSRKKSQKVSQWWLQILQIAYCWQKVMN